jgi:hypothetical protein
VKKLWLTRSGVLVELRGREIKGKREAYRYPTGGFHGLLWCKNLRPAPSQHSKS